MNNPTRRGDLAALHAELRAEIDELAHGQVDQSVGRMGYPDPCLLSRIERRLLTRAVFAFIEACTFGLKQLALESPNAKHLAAADRALALEEDYELGDDGSVVTRTARLRFASNLRFSFRLMAAVAKSEVTLEVGGEGWQSLLRAVKVRDRLTHPKQPADLMVSDNEIGDVLGAFVWYSDQLNRALKGGLQAVRDQVASSHLHGSEAAT